MFKKKVFAMVTAACVMIAYIGCSNQGRSNITGVTTNEDPSTNIAAPFTVAPPIDLSFPEPLNKPVIAIEEIKNLMSPGLEKTLADWRYLYRGDVYFPNCPAGPLPANWVSNHPSYWSVAKFPNNNKNVLGVEIPLFSSFACWTTPGEIHNTHVWAIALAVDQNGTTSHPGVIARRQKYNGKEYYYELWLGAGGIYLSKQFGSKNIPLDFTAYKTNPDTWYCLAITCTEDLIVGQIADATTGKTLAYCSVRDNAIYTGTAGVRAGERGYFLQYAVYELIAQ